MGPFEQFSKEALKAQDGKSVPLTLENGGPIVGEVIFHYDEGAGDLKLEARLESAPITDWLVEKVINDIKES